MANKQSLLDQIKADILSQNICSDLAKQATQLVFGVGNADSELVFIGEAPGKREDIQGEPFVGASGKFLNEMLDTINLNRSDIYITNIVKYRPPNNRDPLPSEKQQFLPFLLHQLDIIEPKLIITLGRHSMEALLPPGATISSTHGKLTRHEGRYYLPLFHPAAAIYNRSLRQTLIDDFLKIPAIIDKIKEI